MNFLDSLNESQRAAVEYCDGPQLVIAGAGSGKTRVLTMKIAYLLEHGYRPGEIIALTFTKKAALEMQKRIAMLVGEQTARRLWMGTFHSLFCRILRIEAARLGLRPDFTIYDQTDSRSLIKSIIKDLKLDDKQYRPNGIQSQISNAKNNLITPGMYSANRELRNYDARAHRPELYKIYEQYWERCRQAGAMDFDDLLVYTNILFRDHPDALAFYQQRFGYVLVDEYQDTNRAQHLIVEQLAQKHGHLTVVGDDAQSIYSFRGANIRNILDLREQVPNLQLFKLEQNYRSTQNIVDAANSLIAKNKEQIQKTIYSQRDRGSLLQLTGTYSDLEEAFQVARRLTHLHDREGHAYTDCAILYRTNAQSRVLEEALRKAGIPYRIYGGLSFYQRKEIKDIISYLRLICNPADEEAFRRIINYPARGIGDTTVAKLSATVSALTAQGTPVTFFDVCSDPAAFGVAVNRGTQAKLQAFAQMIRGFQVQNASLSAWELTQHVIIESGIKADLAQDTSVEGKSRVENVEELLSAIQDFATSAIEEGREAFLVDFLADVSLNGELEPMGHDADDDTQPTDYVTLMTIHAAKGLEFRDVFIVGIEENLLPSDMAKEEPGGIEEERRLFYVAITRAGENCFLSYAQSRFRNGKTEFGKPSRFLRDIDRRFIQQTGITAAEPQEMMGITGGFFGYRPPKASATPQRPTAPTTMRTPVATTVTPLTRRPLSPIATKTSGIPHTAASGTVASGTPHSAASGAGCTISYGGHVLTEGLRIAHERFGQGTIISIEGPADNARIGVRFDTMGEKKLLLKFAKISVLG